MDPDPSDPSLLVGGDYTLPLSEVLLPEMLAPAGYSSAAIGKWHQHRLLPGVATTHPTDSGFGSYVGAPANIGHETFTKSGTPQTLTTSYFPWAKQEGGAFATQVVDAVTYPFYSVYSDPFDPSELNYAHENRYAARDLANEAIERIDGDPAGNLSEPWLLYVAFNLAHEPFHTPPWNLSPLTGPQGVPVGKRLYDLTTPYSTCPSNPAQLCPTVPEQHRAMLEAVDLEIGRLLDAIPTAVRARTTVILASDNGSPRTTVDPPFVAAHVKGSLYEGGINVPLIIRSPRLNASLPTPNGAPACGVTSAHQGKESTALASLVDIFETLRDIAKRFDTNVATTGGSAESKTLLPFLCDPNLGTPQQLPDTHQHSEVYAESFRPDGIPSQHVQSAEDSAVVVYVAGGDRTTGLMERNTRAAGGEPCAVRNTS